MENISAVFFLPLQAAMSVFEKGLSSLHQKLWFVEHIFQNDHTS